MKTLTMYIDKIDQVTSTHGGLGAAQEEDIRIVLARKKTVQQSINSLLITYIKHFNEHSPVCLAGENKEFVSNYMSGFGQSIFRPALAKDIFKEDDFIDQKDVKVHYDYSVRGSSGSILQFVYGDDGMDSTYVESQPLYLTKLPLKKSEGQKQDLFDKFHFDKSTDFKK